MAVTPAGAEVSNAVATNWKKIWKKNLKPLADKRYYTKKQSKARYSTKAETAAGDAASNAATDSKQSGYYTKAEIDAEFAPLVNSAAAPPAATGPSRLCRCRARWCDAGVSKPNVITALGFAVTKGALFTAYLACDEFTGAAASPTAH